MKSVRMVSFFLIAFLLVFSVALSQQKVAHKYVGTKVCMPCHKGEKKGSVHEIWLKSKHAQAYKALESPAAAKIAKEKGLAKPASQSAECLKCHVPTHDFDKSLLMPSFDPKDGVQCETCHGPGSDYKSIPVMKDRAKATAAGIVLAKDDPKLCIKCHNSGSPTYKEFKYEEYWAKIKHTVPKQG